MLSSEERNFLYDSKNFIGVSPESRTDIIHTIRMDLEDLTQEEGGEFTHQELCNGLHYLIASNKDLHAYIEQNKSQPLSSDPFIIPSSGLPDLGRWPCRCRPPSCFCCLGDSGGRNGDCGEEGGKILIACAFLCALAAIIGLCMLIYRNIRDMLKSEEPKVVKIAKIITSLIVFMGVTALAWFFLPTIYVVGLSSVLAVFCGAVVTALFSYVNKKILCFLNKQEKPNELIKPSEKLLEALQVTKDILQYSRKGDDKEACREFVKAVVRMHIKSISKKSSFSGGYGSFHKSVITEQPANDAKQNIEDTPTCSASK